MVSSLLLSILEGTDELWDIIVIIDWGSSLAHVSKSLLQERVLLRSNLLKDIWHHILKVFGLRGSGNNQEVLFHGELGYNQNKVNQSVRQVKKSGLYFDTYFVVS
jgi:CO dehydrogenase/acetyl-CoA synthase epsilon subunit